MQGISQEHFAEGPPDLAEVAPEFKWPGSGWLLAILLFVIVALALLVFSLVILLFFKRNGVRRSPAMGVGPVPRRAALAPAPGVGTFNDESE